MLFPVCCFSCGACIGHLWKLYKEYVNEYTKQIQQNKKIDVVIKLNNQNKREIEDKINKRLNNKNLEPPSAEELALITLNINRLCCRRMFLTHVDTYNIMNLVK